MRGVYGLGLGCLLSLTIASTVSAQDGSDLAVPFARPRAAGALPAAPPVVPEVQDVRSIGAPSVRVYGDGGGDDLDWQDPERDLLPLGNVHFVLVARGAFLAGDAEFREALDVALGPMLDLCLWPALSLHVRLGFWVGGHGPLGVASRPLGEGYARGALLFGAHFGQLVSVRLGAELGTELSFGSGASGIGGAAVAQVGLRLGDGHLELAVDLAVDVRPGSEGPVTYTYVAPRLGGMLGVTF